AQLVRRRFHLAIIGNDFPAPEGLVLAGVVIDRHTDIRLLVRIALLRGRRQRGFHRLEDHFLRHALFIGDRVDDQQKIFAHCINSVSIRPGYRWLNCCAHSGTQNLEHGHGWPRSITLCRRVWAAARNPAPPSPAPRGHSPPGSVRTRTSCLRLPARSAHPVPRSIFRAGGGALPVAPSTTLSLPVRWPFRTVLP